MPSGSLIITKPNQKSLIANFDRIIGRFIENGKWNGHDFSHKYVYAFDEIRDLLRKVCFKVIVVQGFYLFCGLPIRTKSCIDMYTWLLAKR